MDAQGSHGTAAAVKLSMEVSAAAAAPSWPSAPPEGELSLPLTPTGDPLPLLANGGAPLPFAQPTSGKLTAGPSPLGGEVATGPKGQSATGDPLFQPSHSWRLGWWARPLSSLRRLTAAATIRNVVMVMLVTAVMNAALLSVGKGLGNVERRRVGGWCLGAGGVWGGQGGAGAVVLLTNDRCTSRRRESGGGGFFRLRVSGLPRTTFRRALALSVRRQSLSSHSHCSTFLWTQSAPIRCQSPPRSSYASHSVPLLLVFVRIARHPPFLSSSDALRG